MSKKQLVVFWLTLGVLVAIIATPPREDNPGRLGSSAPPVDSFALIQRSVIAFMVGGGLWITFRNRNN